MAIIDNRIALNKEEKIKCFLCGLVCGVFGAAISSCLLAFNFYVANFFFVFFVIIIALMSTICNIVDNRIDLNKPEEICYFLCGLVCGVFGAAIAYYLLSYNFFVAFLYALLFIFVVITFLGKNMKISGE